MVGEGGPQVSVAVGITVGLAASFVQSLGLTMQRKSHVLNEQCNEADRRVEHRRPLWLFGFVIFISSNILGSIFQIASLPVVILAPLGAVSLLWNAFFARILLGDVFSNYLILGTLLIAGGASLIAIFGIVPEPTHSLEDLLRLFAREAFVVYFSLLGASLLAVLVVTHLAEFSLGQAIALPDSADAPLAPLPHPTGPTTAVNETTPLIDPKSNIRLGTSPADQKRFWIAISYASASGILSGMCLLFAKIGVELLVLTASGNNQFWRWEPWMLVFGLVAFALLQLWYLHKALILADPTLVCPLAFCFYNLSSIINGLVYFDQFSALSTRNLLLVMLGIVILLGGVWVVSIQTNADVAELAEVESEELATSPTVSRRPSHAVDEELALGSPIEESGSPGVASRPSVIKRRYPSLLGPESGSGGFSIGLSPSSPGFAVAPRRRITSMQEAAHRLTRRSLSEADVLRRAASESEVDLTDRAPPPRRWQWLRGVFLRR